MIVQTEERKRKMYRCFSANAPYQLSRREIEVAKLLIAGKTIKVIADILEIQIKTIDSHVAGIYSKLGINRKTDICKRTVAVMTLKDLI